MKFVFILNPNAGRGKCKKLLPKIEETCKERKYDYEIRYITDELTADIIAKEYNDSNDECVIYIVGGDGTITKALPSLINSKNSLGIIPAGSGNDTYRSIIKLPKGITTIDTALINGVHFINIACMGIDAEVANNVDIMKTKPIPTSQLYHASLIYTFIKYRFKKAKIKTPVKNIDDYYSIFSVCNGGYYGGGFNIAPKSEMSDGLLDVYYAEKMNRFKMIPLLLKLTQGKHEGKRRIHKIRTNKVEVELDEEVTFNVDGEKVTSKKFKIELVPKSVKIYNDDEFVKTIMK